MSSHFYNLQRLDSTILNTFAGYPTQTRVARGSHTRYLDVQNAISSASVCIYILRGISYDKTAFICTFLEHALAISSDIELVRVKTNPFLGAIYK